VPNEGGGKPEFEIDNGGGGKFSPDGHWIAYSDVTSHQVFVTPFPVPGARVAVSSSAGTDPRWRGDGQELISVQVHESARDFHVLSSRSLFRLPLGIVGFYDVTRDGKRFLVNNRTHRESAAPLTILTNSSALLQNQSSPDMRNH
jgi:hypothetical protein